MTQEEWEQKRDAIRAQYPVGTRVETVPECYGLECEDGIAFTDNHGGGKPVRGIVMGHTASRVEFRDVFGDVWTMVPASLRVVPAIDEASERLDAIYTIVTDGDAPALHDLEAAALRDPLNMARRYSAIIDILTGRRS